MYSSGVTLQAIGIPLKRWGCVLVDTVISGAMTALVIFKGNFYTDLSGFLDYIVVWLGPWFGILLADYLIRRGRYDVLSLAEKRGGLYWRNGDFNESLALGMFGAMMGIHALYYVPSHTGPLSNGIHGADFSCIFGMIVAVLCTGSCRCQASVKRQSPLPRDWTHPFRNRRRGISDRRRQACAAFRGMLPKPCAPYWYRGDAIRLRAPTRGRRPEQIRRRLTARHAIGVERLSECLLVQRPPDQEDAGGSRTCG